MKSQLNKKSRNLARYGLTVVALMLLAGFYFRYDLLFAFQYSRLRSLTCNDSTGSGGDCFSRLWAHRVNSIERYDWIEGSFKGFETDVVFDDPSSSFLVYHPPFPANGRVPALEEFLSGVDLKTKRLWLDTRMVTGDNMSQAIDELNAVDVSVSGALKSAAVIELYDLRAAQGFAASGYSVSLNIDPSMLDKMETDSSYRSYILEATRNVMYVSQESRSLPRLKQQFKHKKIITWHLDFNTYFRMDRLRELMSDGQVAVVLVNVKSPGYR